jgi:hypothetical protein
MSQIIQTESKMNELIQFLPSEIQKNIFYYIPLRNLRSDTAQLINNIIYYYDIDHDPDLTKRAKLYYIKNIMSFYNYVFYTLYREEYEGCIYGRERYDCIEYYEEEYN